LWNIETKVFLSWCRAKHLLILSNLPAYVQLLVENSQNFVGKIYVSYTRRLEECRTRKFILRDLFNMVLETTDEEQRMFSCLYIASSENISKSWFCWDVCQSCRLPSLWGTVFSRSLFLYGVGFWEK
jgi:hypothetical protein